MKLTDVAPLETWQQMAKEIYEKFGVNCGVLDTDNVVVQPPVGWANRACPLIKGNENSRVVCASAQQDMSGRARNSKKTVIGKCDVGFTKFVTPIFYNDEFLGTTGGCGVLLEGDKLENFYISKILNISEKEARELVKDVKIISADDLEKNVNYLEKALLKIIGTI
ncbi:MAG: PocR ligand-binding domain-containing protein [Desulfobacterales bacterium]|uniref:PocR ligand-binding domain-containing protein n=1 Tax=Candidatus Desulfaltia bathyphila TaxID=2841697 RepID=A0A8J6N3S1_9BACT|nr:PocR ligand-binding domain-containing protein [Candidatus Desulfaltia bathyphila]MBL7207914.1 PocR ligand-binding domain-containing protein [Desulfobacterales bacterium]